MKSESVRYAEAMAYIISNYQPKELVDATNQLMVDFAVLLADWSGKIRDTHKDSLTLITVLIDAFKMLEEEEQAEGLMD